MKTFISYLFLLLLFLSATSCSGLQPKTRSESTMCIFTGSPYVDPDTMLRDEIIHLVTGTKLTQPELFDLLAKERIIFVGEGHDNIYDHQVELEVVKNLFQRFPERLAVGFEMLAHLNQDKVDLWLNGDLSDEFFIRLFAEDWSVAEYVYYREIFTFLKKNKIPVIALNVSRQEKMKFMQEMMASGKNSSSSSEQKKSAPVIADPYQEEALQAMFKGHTEGHGDVSMFLKVHQLWEDTMADNIYNYLRNPAGSGKLLVVIAGGFHVAHGYGLPRRVFQRTKANYSTLLTHTPEVLIENERRTMDVDFPEMPLYLCDYLWCVPYRNLKDKQARLGVGMQKADSGIEVVMVEAESAAEKHGLKIGDVLVGGDGNRLTDPYDLSILLLEKVKGDVVKLEIERDGKLLVVEILL